MCRYVQGLQAGEGGGARGGRGEGHEGLQAGEGSGGRGGRGEGHEGLQAGEGARGRGGRAMRACRGPEAEGGGGRALRAYRPGEQVSMWGHCGLAQVRAPNTSTQLWVSSGEGAQH